MRKKGFTLIELLAVIVILGILAFIVTPMILNTIEKAKKGAFKDSIYGIMNAAELKMTITGSFEPMTFIYPEKEGNLQLEFKGEEPTEGYLQILKNGKIVLKLGNGTWCASKLETEEEPVLIKGKCQGLDLNVPIITGYGELIQSISLHELYIFPNVIATTYQGKPLSFKKTIKKGMVVVDQIDSSVPGSYTIEYSATDLENGLNTTKVVTIVVLDKTPPVIEEVTISSKELDYFSLDTSVKIKAKDESKMEMNLSNTGYGEGKWQPYQENFPWNVEGTLDGKERIIYLVIKDEQGNKTEKEISYLPYQECSRITDKNFGTWGNCSKTCGGGTQEAVGQKIDNYTLKNCGVATKSQECNTQECGLMASDIISISRASYNNGKFYFAGKNSNNYVKIDGQYWRLVYVEDNKIKIVKDSPIGQMPWDEKNTTNWSSSTLSTYLNGTYYSSLSAQFKSRILERTLWQIGKVDSNPYPLTAARASSSEKTNSWYGTVGLLTLSDYAYTTDYPYCLNSLISNCATVTWIGMDPHQWFMIASSDNKYIWVQYQSNIYNTYYPNLSYYVRPAVILKENTSFAKGGTGTSVNPYVFAN